MTRTAITAARRIAATMFDVRGERAVGARVNSSRFDGSATSDASRVAPPRYRHASTRVFRSSRTSHGIPRATEIARHASWTIWVSCERSAIREAAFSETPSQRANLKAARCQARSRLKLAATLIIDTFRDICSASINRERALTSTCVRAVCEAVRSCNFASLWNIEFRFIGLSIMHSHFGDEH